MGDLDRLKAYAERTARELVSADIALDGLPITTYRTVMHRSGFLGLRTQEVREVGPEERPPIGWLLWSHEAREGKQWDSSDGGRRRQTHLWEISRGWWLLPEGAIDVVEHREELVISNMTWHRSIEDRHRATDEELVQPDLPWRGWRPRDDKRFARYEQGQSPVGLMRDARKPGLALSAALTHLRKKHGTYAVHDR